MKFTSRFSPIPFLSLSGTQLAWHCAGTYSKFTGEGGSNGARMRFDPEASWGANAGLGVPRKALEDVKVRPSPSRCFS